VEKRLCECLYFIFLRVSTGHRHKIRDCGSRKEVGERLKAFGDFVSMFDETWED